MDCHIVDFPIAISAGFEMRIGGGNQAVEVEVETRRISRKAQYVHDMSTPCCIVIQVLVKSEGTSCQLASFMLWSETEGWEISLGMGV